MAAATGAMLSQCARRENPGLAMQKILVADVPQLDARLSGALGGRSLAFVRTLLEAERRLAAEEFGLVIIGLHFDDSRMFDLLRYVRSASRRRDQPVICLRSLSHRTSAISSESLKIACEALGADAFLDFGAYASEAAADAALGQAANGLLKQGRDC
jgi:PleD family two-component response regulator